jgi:DNA-binding NtrC family response regulator
MGKNIRILLIEDNPGDAYLIKEYLEEFASFSYELIIVETLGEALSALKKKHFDVILLDLELPDSFGVDTFLSIHNKYPTIPHIILTGLNDEKIGTYAIKEGAHDFLIKGRTEGRLLECIKQCTIEHKKKAVLYY